MAGKFFGGRPTVAVALFVASFAVVFPMIFAATTHTVGDSTGWTIPPSKTFYPNWSTSQKFAIGDTLVFNFPTGAHTVVEVPKLSYDACTTNNQIGATITAGPANVTITSAGEHYYICSVVGHCSLNQKLSITVSGDGSSPPSSDSPAPVPAPTAGGPSTGGDSAAPPASTVGMAAAAAAGIFMAVALW